MGLGDVSAGEVVGPNVGSVDVPVVDEVLERAGVLAPGCSAIVGLWDGPESAGELFGRVLCEGLDAALEGAGQGFADHRAVGGEIVALIGGRLQGGPAGVLVFCELLDQGA